MKKNTDLSAMNEDIKVRGRLFLNNELIISRIFVAWALGCVVLFGGFGSSHLIINLTKKIKLYREMRQLNYDLNVNLQKLSVLSDDVKAAKRFEEYLSSGISTSFDTHGYMASFMTEVSGTGYGVRSFVPATEATDKEIPITVRLQGAGDLSKLVEAIEALPRVTVINSVSYTGGKDTSEVIVSLKIFDLGEIVPEQVTAENSTDLHAN